MNWHLHSTTDTLFNQRPFPIYVKVDILKGNDSSAFTHRNRIFIYYIPVRYKIFQPSREITGLIYGKVNLSCYRSGVALRVPGTYDSQISRQRHGKVVSLWALRTGRLYLQEMFLVLISRRGWDRMGFMSMKNSSDTSWDRTSDLPICSTAN